MVRDANGEEARVFIDGYICTDEDVKDLSVGAAITVTGLASYDESFAGPAPRIRVRNRAEVVCVPGAELPFTDVKKDAWYYDGVAYSYFNGYFKGLSETIFAPNATVNRAMIVTVLYRLAGEPEVENLTSFRDVNASRYYAKAIAWASENGIVSGYKDGTFRPNQAATRQELAVILYRFGQYSGCDMSLKGDLDSYKDSKAIGGWAREAMAWCVGAGLLQGDPAGSLTPKGTATRAQYATIIMRLRESLMK